MSRATPHDTVPMPRLLSTCCLLFLLFHGCCLLLHGLPCCPHPVACLPPGPHLPPCIPIVFLHSRSASLPPHCLTAIPLGCPPSPWLVLPSNCLLPRKPSGTAGLPAACCPYGLPKPPHLRLPAFTFNVSLSLSRELLRHSGGAHCGDECR